MGRSLGRRVAAAEPGSDHGKEPSSRQRRVPPDGLQDESIERVAGSLPERILEEITSARCTVGGARAPQTSTD